MVDVGATATGQAPQVDASNANSERDQRSYGLCAACDAGGGHFNQWTISIQNEAIATPAPNPTPTPTPPPPPPVNPSAPGK